MATGIKACIVAFGLALVYSVADGAVPRHFSFGNKQLHRVLAENSTSGVTIFDVTKYGAVADNKKDNAEAFMKTWRAACDSGAPAKMVIPTGTFMTSPVVFQGPCKYKGTITFEIQGHVNAVDDLSMYPDQMWVAFEIIDGLVLTGGGAFDGKGQSAWGYNDCKKNADCQGLPDNLKFHRVTNSVIQHITSVNSKYFHFHMVYCNHISFFNVTITAPSNSPNTDGIHISNSDYINVTSTKIGTGDDCISIGQGATNVNVKNVFCGPGHGLSVGSLGKYKNERDVTGIHFQNCTLFNTTNGARIKSYPDSQPSLATDIRFEDIIVNSVKNPIIIDQKYGSHKSQPSRVKISGVVFKNIRGTSTSDVAVNLMCSSLVPCENVAISDVDFSYIGPARKNAPAAVTASCLNAKVTSSGKLNPPACH